jgi:hypothetical protein
MVKFVDYFKGILNYPDISLQPELELFFQIIRHLAAFPFEPDITAPITATGFLRAMLLTYRESDSAVENDSGDIGKFLRCFSGRARTPTDKRRAFFRAIARPKPAIHKSTPTDQSFRQVSVSYYRYYIAVEGAALFTEEFNATCRDVKIKRMEDERKVDALDVVACRTYHRRVCHSPVLHLQPSLPLYKLYLDELMITRTDLVNFIRLILVVKAKLHDNPISWSHEITSDTEVIVSKFGVEEWISWETFDESIVLHFVRCIYN